MGERASELMAKPEADGMYRSISETLLVHFPVGDRAALPEPPAYSRYELETHLSVLQVLTGRMLETRREWDALRIDEATRRVDLESLEAARENLSAKLVDDAEESRKAAIEAQRASLKARKDAMDEKTRCLESLLGIVTNGYVTNEGRTIKGTALAVAATDVSMRLSERHNDAIAHHHISFPYEPDPKDYKTLLHFGRLAAHHATEVTEEREKGQINAALQDVGADLAALQGEAKEVEARWAVFAAECAERASNIKKLDAEIEGKRQILEQGRSYGHRMYGLMILFQRDRLEAGMRARAAALALDHFYGWHVPPPIIDTDTIEVDTFVVWVREAVAAHNAAVATDRAGTLRMQCHGEAFAALAGSNGEIATFKLTPPKSTGETLGSRITWVRVNLIPKKDAVPLGSFEVSVSPPSHAHWAKTRMEEVPPPTTVMPEPRQWPRKPRLGMGTVFLEAETGAKNYALREEFPDLGAFAEATRGLPGLPDPRPGLPRPELPRDTTVKPVPARRERAVTRLELVVQNEVVQLTPVVPRSSFSDLARTTSIRLANRCPFGVGSWKGALPQVQVPQGFNFVRGPETGVPEGSGIWRVDISSTSSIDEPLAAVCQAIELEVGYVL